VAAAAHLFAASDLDAEENLEVQMLGRDAAVQRLMLAAPEHLMVALRSLTCRCRTPACAAWAIQ
jgi:hypothetical protein